MDARTELQECIRNMTEEAVLKLFEAAEKIMLAEEGRIDSVPIVGIKPSSDTERSVANKGIIASID